jgi:hypothetical protein
MKLEYEFSYQAMLKEPLPIGAGPYGNRIFVEVIGGRAEGPRLRAKLLTGGGDWLLIGADGFGRLDVRAQFLTDDGAAIYVSYYGILQATEALQRGLADGKTGTDFGDQYFRSQPRFETGDPRYAWMTQSVFVGEGRLLPNRTVDYRVHRVA